MFKRTTSINKILSLNGRIKIIQGGTSAGKTFGILPILIDKCAKENGLEVSVVAETIPHLRRGALKDFLKIMRWTNRYFDDRFNKTLLRYDFANGSSIEFFSADDASKLRGARRDILYINECNNVTFEAYNELSIRTKKEVYLDFNPANVYNYNGTRIINELVYRTGMVNSDIAKILPSGIIIYADSSEPKSIEEIRRSG
jgi:phage terminase large subunit